MKDLKNSYLEYSSEITEDIYDKIVEKLEEIGFICGGEVAVNYKGFKKHGYLTITNDTWNTSTDNDDTKKQITVEDILGDDFKNRHQSGVFEKGDKVKVIKTIKTADLRENGWDDIWGENMNKYVGEIGYIIKDEGVNGYRIDFNDDNKFKYNFPSFVLEKIQDDTDIIGKWVKHKNGDDYFLACITDIVEDGYKGYGFDYHHNWFSDGVFNEIFKPFVIATSEEVNQRLLDYAKKNYPEGTGYRDANVNTDWGDLFSDGRPVKILYKDKNGYALNIEAGRGYIYYEGKWAEIISESKQEKTDNEEVKIGDIVWVSKNKTGKEEQRILNHITRKKQLSIREALDDMKTETEDIDEIQLNKRQSLFNLYNY